MEIPDGIKAISFDGDGTLWDFQKVMTHSMECVLAEVEKIRPSLKGRLTVHGMVRTRNRVAAELKGRVTNLETVRLEAFRETLREIDSPDETLARHLNEVYLEHRFEDLEPYEDCLPALNALKARYAIGLLSNGNSYPDRTGFGGMFQFVVFSQDHGFEKPDQRIFEVALEKAGCSKHEMIHVGDSLENDVVGAKNADVRSVWLNRAGLLDQTGIRPDYEIRSLAELTCFHAL